MVCKGNLSSNIHAKCYLCRCFSEPDANRGSGWDIRRCGAAHAAVLEFRPAAAATTAAAIYPEHGTQFNTLKNITNIDMKLMI